MFYVFYFIINIFEKKLDAVYLVFLYRRRLFVLNAKQYRPEHL